MSKGVEHEITSPSTDERVGHISFLGVGVQVVEISVSDDCFRLKRRLNRNKKTLDILKILFYIFVLWAYEQ